MQTDDDRPSAGTETPGEAAGGSVPTSTMEVSREMGKWTIRINGIFIADYWRESIARRTAMNLIRACGKT